MNFRFNRRILLFVLVFIPLLAFATNENVGSVQADVDAYRLLIQHNAPLSEFSPLLTDNLIRGDTVVIGEVSAAQYAALFRRHDLLSVFVENKSIAERSAIEGVYWEICRNFSLKTVEVLKVDKLNYDAFFIEDADFRANCLSHAVTHLYPELLSLVDDAKKLNPKEIEIVESKLETIEESVEEIRHFLAN